MWRKCKNISRTILKTRVCSLFHHLVYWRNLQLEKNRLYSKNIRETVANHQIKPGRPAFDVNARSVVAFRELGKGHTAMTKFCGFMNIPNALHRKAYNYYYYLRIQIIRPRRPLNLSNMNLRLVVEFTCVPLPRLVEFALEHIKVFGIDHDPWKVIPRSRPSVVNVV